MSISTTQWSPDTCTCVIAYDVEYDSSGNAVRILGLNASGVVRVGSELAHQITPGYPQTSGVAWYSGVMEENVRKNVVIGIAESVKSGMVLNLQSRYSFNAPSVFPRTLTIFVSGLLNSPQTSTFRTLCNTRFGSGLVFIS